LKPLIIAHRGDSGSNPENTEISFKRAVEKEADGVELDVHLTSDNKLVVIHDETINRTTKNKGEVKNLSLKEITKLDAGSYYSDDFSEEKVPSLKSVLEIVSDMKIINIELKNNKNNYEGLEEEVIRLTKNMGLFSKILFSSFNHYSIKKIKKLDSKAKAGVLYKSWLYKPWEYALRLGIKNINPHYRAVNRDIINECQKRNINVNVYGTNRQDKIKKLIENGVDMIICDYPAKSIKLRNKLLKS